MIDFYNENIKIYGDYMNNALSLNYQNDLERLEVGIMELENAETFSKSFHSFDSKDLIIQSIDIFLDKVQGSFVLGVKIIIVVFFFI